MDEITYRGIDSLDAVEKATMESICTKEFSKIKRSLTSGSLTVRAGTFWDCSSGGPGVSKL